MFVNKKIEDKAIIVGINLNEDPDYESSMEELKNLIDAADIKYLGRLDQNLKKVDPSFNVGIGKVKELKGLIGELDANIVVFNEELTPSQVRNLEKEIDITILDRTSLILEIFASRAKTKEAKIQVEIASLQYTMPRLIGSQTYLGRQGGGGKRNKGLGETKLELDRRKIGKRLITLYKELEQIAKERETRRQNRISNEIPFISLIGYTNAGKSTLMNSMLTKFGRDDNKKVIEKNMLFTTLDTTVRAITLKDKSKLLISDTVGFISKLPHSLVKAFRSTLEEVTKSDLLLHVVDYSDSEFQSKIEVSNEVLKEIGAEEIPTIYVYNKSENHEIILPRREGDSIYISAKLNLGIDGLIDLIKEKIFVSYRDFNLFIPYENAKEASEILSKFIIKSEEELEDGIKLEVFTKESYLKKYQQFLL